MKRILIVFSIFMTFTFIAQEVKTQKDILGIPNTDLVKDYNLKSKGSIKPLTVTKSTFTDIGFMFNTTHFQYLENYILAEEFTFKKDRLIKHRQYSNFSNIKTESTSYYTYDAAENLAKREFEQKKGQGSQTTTYEYKNDKIKKIRDFGILGNGKKFNTVKNFAQNLNYLSYEINGNTNTYQYKNGLISKVQNLNNKTNKSIITKYAYNKEKYITSITYDKNFTSFQLNKKNLIVKESNKTYNQHFKYVYDKYGNWIIAYQLSVNDKDYSGNKTKIQLYGKRFSFYLREIKYSNGDVTGGKTVEHKNINKDLLRVRKELYDELINGKKPFVKVTFNYSDLGLPKTDLVYDYGLKIGKNNIIPKFVNEKQFDQRQNRNSEFITKLERERYKVFNTKIKKITSFNIVYNGKTTYQNYKYNNVGNLISYKNSGSSIDSKKSFIYKKNNDLSYTTTYNGEVKGVKQDIKKTDYGYITCGLTNQNIL